MTDLRTDGLWKGIGHRPMVEGSKYPPLAVHREIARRPDGRGPHIAGENSVPGGKLVEDPDHMLRMDGFLAPLTRRNLVETLPRFLIMRQRALQMLVITLCVQLWQQGSEGSPRVSHKTVIDLGAPSQLFSPDVDLDDRRILGEELLVGKVRSNHQQEVAVHHRVIAG